MPKDNKLEARLVRFYEGDIDTIKRFYPRVGYNIVVRELVHTHCRSLIEAEARNPEVNSDFAKQLAEPLTLDRLSAIKPGDEHDQ